MQIDEITEGLVAIRDDTPRTLHDRRDTLAEAANRLQSAQAFIEMVRGSVEGGGHVVTFSDTDLTEMNRLLGRD